MQTPSVIARRRFQMSSVTGILGLAMAAGFWATVARADSITNTYNSGQVTGGQTGFTQNGNSDGISGQYNFTMGFSQFTTQFNPALGTLNSITITLNLALSMPASANYQQFNAGQSSPGNFSHTPSMNVALIDFGNHTLGNVSGSTNDSFSVPSGSTTSHTTQLNLSQTFTLTDAQSLADFTTGGNAYPPQFNIGGNGSDSFSTTAASGSPNTPYGTFSDTIVFNYSPTPEPSTIALGVLGAGALILARQRKQSA